MPAPRVAKLEALLVRVQTRAAESRSRRGSPVASVAAVARDATPAPNPTPIRRSQFDEDEVTGKVPLVAELPRAEAAPQVIPVAAKSAPKVAAAPVARVVEPEPRVVEPEPRVVEPVPVVAAVLLAPVSPVAPVVEAPAPVIAHAATAPEPEVFAPPPAPVHAIPEPTPLGPPYQAEVRPEFRPEVREEVALAKTQSPEPVAIVRPKDPEPKRGEIAASSPVVSDAQALALEPTVPPSRGRQFLVAMLLILWILAVAAVVGLFFTGRLPMP